MASLVGVSALLDTNVLKEIVSPSKKAEHFAPIFDFLKLNKMVPYYLDATKFELKGYSSSKRSFDTTEKFLETLDTWKAPVTQEDIEKATLLSSMYKCKSPDISPKQISFVDCLHAVQLLRYKERVAIVTADINDYPSFLFDMPHYFPIPEENGATFFVAVKTYNEEKWKKLNECFEKSA